MYEFINTIDRLLQILLFHKTNEHHTNFIGNVIQIIVKGKFIEGKKWVQI